jgi:hypothetical protein
LSGYLVTSPHRPERFHRWFCDRLDCGHEGGGSGSEREEIRSAATAHIERTGHGVTIIDGTSEHLYGLATAAEVPEAGR